MNSQETMSQGIAIEEARSGSTDFVEVEEMEQESLFDRLMSCFRGKKNKDPNEYDEEEYWECGTVDSYDGFTEGGWVEDDWDSLMEECMSTLNYTKKWYSEQLERKEDTDMRTTAMIKPIQE